MESSGGFLLLWLGFLAIMLVVLAGILLWAIRSRQFSDQDRARYLPLDGWDGTHLEAETGEGSSGDNACSPSPCPLPQGEG